MCAASQSDQLAGNVFDRLKEELTKEDLERRRSGVTFSHRVTPAEFLQYALKVEAAQ